ncbi:hypothetical protein [uncultured Roseovarius sp.]|uniref:hypothetical protein n=1 Tax=uncultured Roseovarius sp. TaxID=293344 RepID=UPI00260DC26D|nr:hypothetical protein [uncultured Roseovarius sp.]
MILNEPQAQCPFCRGFMTGWLSRYPAKSCDLCDRPLFLLPNIFRKHHLTILSALDVAKVVMLPVVAGATVSFGLGGLSVDAFARSVAAALLFWGLLDVWDGTSGLKTGIDRVKRRIRRDASARRMSAAKTFFGLTSVVLGGLGLLLVQ